MAIIQINKGVKEFNGEAILENINIAINENEKVAIVGPNGTGKSTILKILSGVYELEKGEVFLSNNKTVGYLDQNPVYNQGETLFEHVISSFSNILDLRLDLNILEEKMSHSDGDLLEKQMEEYSKKVEIYESSNGYAIEAQTRKVLSGLGFDNEDFIKKMEYLSGGEKRRASLAKLLVKEDDILFLDEPTNHLDVDAIEWLEDFLAQYKGTMVLISHDRYFLDKIVNRVFEITNKSIRDFKGNYSKYEELKELSDLSQKRAFEKQQEKIRDVREYIKKYKAGIKSKQARGREKQLERLELVSDIFSNKTIKLRFYEATETGKEVLVLKKVDKKIHDGLRFKEVDLEVMKGDVIGIVGKNGAGKTSFLDMIVNESMDSGQVKYGSRVKMSYFDQLHADLHPENKIVDEILSNFDLTKEEVRSILARILFREDDLDKKIKYLSGGEKARVAFTKLILKKPNFLILDEPTNHLDMDSKEIISRALSDFEGTILFVSHDRFLLDLLCTKIVEIDNGRINLFEGNYSEYREARARQKAKKLEARQDKKVPQKEEKKKSFNRYKVTHRIEELEDLIGENEIEKDETFAKLSDPEVYKDHKLAEELQTKYEEIEKKLEAYVEEWEELSILLDENTK